MKISVIICTYNPSDIHFTKCIEAIEAAHMHERIDEVIIVDNNSLPSLNERPYLQEYCKRFDLISVVNEPVQGLTYARLKGIEVSKGDLLIFIDDDNIIYPDFFLNSKKLFYSHPTIGSFSGQIFLQFDFAPPQWSKRYWGMLVSREFQEDASSNLLSFEGPIPCGAGLCVRREVAEFYHKLHFSGKRKLILDRSKDSLMSAGDNDLALCSLDVGLRYGLFECLKVNHLIPAYRVEKAYLKRLAYGIYYSAEVLFYMRGHVATRLSLKEKIKNVFLPLRMSAFDREILRTCHRARRDARRFNRSVLLDKTR